MDHFVLLILLAALAAVLTASQYFGQNDESDDEAASSDPVSRHLGAANYGKPEAAAAARRQILAIGPAVSVQLFDRLARSDDSPTLLNPRTQRFIEHILADFGVGGFVALRHRLVEIDAGHRAVPSIVRVLSEMGAPAIEQGVREEATLRFLLVLPALLRVSDAEFARVLHNVPVFAPQLGQTLASLVAVRLVLREQSDPFEFEALPDVVVEALSETANPKQPGAIIEARRRQLVLPIAEAIAAAQRSVDPEAEQTSDMPGVAGVRALLNLAVHNPEVAMTAFARRFRVGSWPRDGVVHLCACVQVLGPRAQRLVIEQLRHGREPAWELARAAVGMVDASNGLLPLLAVVARGRSRETSVVAGYAVLRSAPGSLAFIRAALEESDVDVRAGAARILGILGDVGSVEALARRASLMLGDRGVMLQSIEMIGRAGATEVTRASVQGFLPRNDPDSARLVQLVTLLATEPDPPAPD